MKQANHHAMLGQSLCLELYIRVPPELSTRRACTRRSTRHKDGRVGSGGPYSGRQGEQEEEEEAVLVGVVQEHLVAEAPLPRPPT